MICGIDTYHDSASKNSSVCAFIATSNAAKTKYFSRATIQQTHQELSNNLMLTVKCKEIIFHLILILKIFQKIKCFYFSILSLIGTLL